PPPSRSPTSSERSRCAAPKAIPERMSPSPRAAAGTATALRAARGKTASLRGGATLALASAIVALLSGDVSRAATTYLSARQDSDKGHRQSLVSVSMDFNSQPKSLTAGGGYVVLDGILSGSRARLKFSGGGFMDYIGRTFYAGLAPVLGQEHLLLETGSFNTWEQVLDPDGTVDENLGIIFGEVRDAAGAPIAGATVTITPDEGGHLFYFDDAGAPSLTLTETSTSGRFIFLDVPPGDVAVNAALLSGGPSVERLGGGPVGTLLGRAYGRV